jgi:hypothetical protein
MEVKKAIKLRHGAQHKKHLASSSESLRNQFDASVADNMTFESEALLRPLAPLRLGAGGEILPPYEMGLSGLELV